MSALNFIPTASSGRAPAMALPSMLLGTFWRSRKAERGSESGGILEDLGWVSERLLCTLFQLKVWNMSWKSVGGDVVEELGIVGTLSVSIGALVELLSSIVDRMSQIV